MPYSTGITTADQNVYRYGANKRRQHPVHPPTWKRPLSSIVSENSGLRDKPGPTNMSPASNFVAQSQDISMDARTDCGKYNQENNAEKWFDDSNKNVSSNRNVAFNDCECGRMHLLKYDC